MRAKAFAVVAACFAITGVSTWALASPAARYEFDRVEAEYAAFFVIDPVNVTYDDWAYQLMGSANGSLNVTYGVVRFWNANSSGSEEFIRLEGANGSRRFLLNSLSTDVFPNSTTPESIRSFFWSAKRLDNRSIVKDGTPPVWSVELRREFNETGHLIGISLSTSNDGGRAGQEFWAGFPATNTWRARSDTLLQAGEAGSVGAA